jgi:hypothetical protein
VLPALVAIAPIFPWLYGHVRDVRERVRRTPHVSVFGQGSANHVTKWIHGSGVPSSEVNHLIGEAVNHFVDDDSPREIEFVRWAKTKGLGHSRAVQLCIDVSQLSGTALGRLREIPRTDGIHLGILIETSLLTDDGLHGLKALANVDSLVVRGTRVSPSAVAALKGSLPDCTVEIEEIVEVIDE